MTCAPCKFKKDQYLTWLPRQLSITGGQQLPQPCYILQNPGKTASYIEKVPKKIHGFLFWNFNWKENRATGIICYEVEIPRIKPWESFFLIFQNHEARTYLQPHYGNGVLGNVVQLKGDFSWTTLRGKHCRHPIAVMGVVDTFGHSVIAFLQIGICCLIMYFISKLFMVLQHTIICCCNEKFDFIHFCQKTKSQLQILTGLLSCD